VQGGTANEHVLHDAIVVQLQEHPAALVHCSVSAQMKIPSPHGSEHAPAAYVDCFNPLSNSTASTKAKVDHTVFFKIFFMGKDIVNKIRYIINDIFYNDLLNNVK